MSRETDQDYSDRTPDVSVVIVNYNVREFLSQALRSVRRASSGLRVETIVVDNNSIDGSVQMLREDFPEVVVIANETNVGFGRANNMAIRRARGRHILILNPDTIVQEDTIVKLTGFLDEHPECGAVGCQILNPDGSFAPESRRSFPTPAIAFYRMTGLSHLFPRSRLFGRYNMTHVPRDQTVEVDALSGSCMMVRRRALLGPGVNGQEHPPAGLFDEDFFMYGEDLDLCYRIQEAGWSIMYYPGTQIIHYKGESTKKGETRYVRLFYGAMLLFIEKHLDRRHSGLLASALRIGIFVRASMTVLGNHLKRLAWPLADIATVYAVVTIVGWTRSVTAPVEFAPLFYLTVAPAYALATAAGVSIAGGYRRPRRLAARPVIVGVGLGFLVVATLSLYVQSIAFSRIVIAGSLPTAAVLMLAGRFLASIKQRGPRRAILVGEADEAHRLRRMLLGHPSPPFQLEGYVMDTTTHSEAPWPGHPEAAFPGNTSNGPRRLGRISHLRDLVRLRGFDDIVFAAKSVSNQTIIRTMRALGDLGVQYRMLSEGEEHVIGKSTVSHVSVASLLSDMPELVDLRSPMAKFTFDRIISLLLMPLIPIAGAGCLITGKTSAAYRLYRRLSKLPQVWTGSKALVGYQPDHAAQIPEAWNLQEGIFFVTNTESAKELDSDDILRAHWYYVTHQSASLDWDIISRSIRRP